MDNVLALLFGILGLILGLLAGYFKFKPQVPPLLYPEKTFKKLESVTIPATGGRANFMDEAGEKFQVILPEQIPPREIIFTSIEPNPNPPNPGKKSKIRIIINLKARDAAGDVEYFYPMLTTIARYNDRDLDQERVGKDPKRLRRYYNDGIEWIELGMPKDAVDTENQQITAFVASFSSCGI